MHVLILYGSLEGQTEKIASYISQRIQQKGHEVSTIPGNHLPADFSELHYDAVIIGSSIHMDSYPKYIKKSPCLNGTGLTIFPRHFSRCVWRSIVNRPKR